MIKGMKRNQTITLKMFEQLATFMQSMNNQLVSLCNLSDMCATVQLSQEFFLMYSFFKNILQCNRGKTSLYELRTDMCFI